MCTNHFDTKKFHWKLYDGTWAFTSKNGFDTVENEPSRVTWLNFLIPLPLKCKYDTKYVSVYTSRPDIHWLYFSKVRAAVRASYLFTGFELKCQTCEIKSRNRCARKKPALQRSTTTWYRHEPPNRVKAITNALYIIGKSHSCPHPYLPLWISHSWSGRARILLQLKSCAHSFLTKLSMDLEPASLFVSDEIGPRD